MTTDPHAPNHSDLLAQFPWIQRLAASLVRDPNAADDLAQETMLKALLSPPRTSSLTGLRAWLARVTRRLAFHAARSEERRSSRERSHEGTAASCDPAQSVSADALHRQVVELVLGLDEPTRSAILYRYFDELSSREIAERTGTTPGAVRQRLSRGLRELRTRLDETHGARGLWALPLVRLGRGSRPTQRRWKRRLVWTTGGTLATLGVLLILDELFADHGPVVGYAQAPVPIEDERQERARLVAFQQAEATSDEVELTDEALGEWTRRFDAIFEHAFRLEGFPPAAVRAQVAALSGLPEDALDDARVLRLEAQPIEGRELPGWLATVSLDQGAVALIVGVDGLLLDVALWGASTFDENRYGGWSVFVEQLQRARIHTLDPESAPTPEGIDALLAQLAEDDGDEAEARRTLSRNRLIMRRNSFRFTRISRANRLGEPPTEEWMAAWARDYASLSDDAAMLEPWIGGDNVERFRELSSAGAERLSEAASAISAQDYARASGLIGGWLYKETCSACHALESERLGGPIYERLVGEHLAPTGVRSDLFRIGHDLWAEPGQESTAQAVADRVRALLLLLGSRP